MKKNIDEKLKAKIMGLHEEGKKPGEIFDAVKSLGRGITKAKVGYVVSYYGRKIAQDKAKLTPAARKVPATDTRLELMTSQVLINTLRTIAFVDVVPAETRLEMIKNILKS